MHRTVLYWVAKSPDYTAAALGRSVARIYCMGTPAVWWLAAAGPSLFVAWAISLPVLFRRALPWTSLGVGLFLGTGYLVNWLPFVIVERVAFLYHFLPSMIYSLLLLGFMLDRILPPVPLLAPPSDALAAAEPVPPASSSSVPSPDPKSQKKESAALAADATHATPESPALPAAQADAMREPFEVVATRDGALRWLVAAVCIQVMAGFFAFFAPLMYGTPLSVDALKMRFWLKSWE